MSTSVMALGITDKRTPCPQVPWQQELQAKGSPCLEVSWHKGLQEKRSTYLKVPWYNGLQGKRSPVYKCHGIKDNRERDPRVLQ